LSPAESDRYLAVISPAICLADAAHADVTSATAIVVAEESSARPLSDRLGPALSEPGSPTPRAATDPAIILPTGGTTGTPKAVEISHASVWQQAQLSAVSWGRIHGDMELWHAPLYHLGLVVCPLASLLAGAACRIMSGFDVDRVVDTITRGHITHLSGPFTVHQMIWSHPRFSPKRTDRVRRVMIGGSAATSETLEHLMACYPHARLRHGYTATESGVVAQLTDEHLAQGRRTGVGHAVPGASIDIVGPDGNILPTGTEGLVVARTPWSANRYVDNPEATSATFRFGGVCVGDVGVLDDDGWLTLLGRTSDMIKSGGENVFPLEVEQVLDRHPAVDASVVYAVTDPKWGERVEAAVVLKNGTDVSVQDLQDFIRGEIASYKLPKVTRIVESLPLTANNKPDRRALRAAAERSPESTG
jgi:acyl-CoA synthetase (AMP-forming)/AMP-acid ligase II